MGATGGRIDTAFPVGIPASSYLLSVDVVVGAVALRDWLDLTREIKEPRRCQRGHYTQRQTDSSSSE